MVAHRISQDKSAEEILNATQTIMTNSQAERKLRMTLFLTENRTEYVNRQMSMFLIQNNIKHHRTVPYCPHQTRQAERGNQTITNIARCALIESKLPYEFWPFAVNYATYTLYCLPTNA